MTSMKVTLHWLCACLPLLVMTAACSGARDHTDAEGTATQTQAREEPPPPERAGSPQSVELNSGMQQALHLKIEALTSMTTSPQLPAFGRVLDPAALANDVSELNTARAAASASEQELTRTKTLQNQNTASLRALQAAEAAAVRDHLLVQTVRDRIELSWGRALANRADLDGLTRALASQERVMVRVDLPLGEALPVGPRSARVRTPTEPEAAVDAELVDLAPNTDPQLQGRGFLFLTRGNPLHLTPGAAVSATLEMPGPALHGVFLPESAILRQGEETWVYVQTAATRFVRRPVTLDTPVSGGWLITQDLQPQERAVTHGAQALLSQELKPEALAD